MSNELCDTIVSPAISGLPLEVGQKAFEAVAKTTDEVSELKGQVAQLTQLLGAVLAGQKVESGATTEAAAPTEVEAAPTASKAKSKA